MRTIGFALVVILLAACASGNVRTGDDGRVAPVYHASADMVFEAARLACTQFPIVDDVDRASLHLACTATHALGGDTHLAINLHTQPDGMVSVSVTCLMDPDENPGWGRQAHDYDHFMELLDEEMHRRLTVEPPAQ